MKNKLIHLRTLLRDALDFSETQLNESKLSSVDIQIVPEVEDRLTVIIDYLTSKIDSL